VTQSDDRIYCATPYSLFYIEKSDGSINTITKTTGLSDANPAHMAYNAGKNTLVITYANSNIDILVNGTDLYNIPDIKNAQTGSSKNINDIATIGDYAYLATDLGISVLDPDKQEIKESYIIGDTGQSVQVNSIASDGTSIYAATSEGLKSASLSSTNLENYANWTAYGTANGLPKGASTLTGQIGGKFYTVIKDTLYVGTGSIFTKVRYDSTYTYQSFCNSDGYLYAFLWNTYSSKALRISTDGTILEVNFPKSPRPLQITKTGTNNWIADEWGGLIKYDDTTYLNNVFLSGPPDIGVYRMTVSNENILYMAAGGTDPSYITPNYNVDGPISYDHTSWMNYNINQYGQIAGCYDLADVAVDEVNKKVYYASLQGGVVERDLTTGNLTKYDTTNSPLGIFFYVPIVKTTALCVDQSGNLWVSNPGAPQTLAVKTPNGTWAKFSLPNDVNAGNQVARRMIVDDYGQIWMGGKANNMVVYNPGQNVLDASDDQSVSLNTATGGGGLPNTEVWAIVKDKNGDIWVGTEQGIATFYCAGSVLGTGGCDATLIKVNQGGFIGYLFSTEIVKAIAVDGANRKWVGTTNGVWLISADGTTQLLHFTSDDSPLPSNTITDIAVDEYTGEVFIGTDQGLVSYQGDAILGGSEKGKALVYPNPVKPDYTGPIAIKGLVDNAYVKITDASGILVFQGRANGGQMIWDGKGYNGTKVQTGVYLVYADTDLGQQHNVGKIVFIH
jgi:hypothetical protein